MNTLKFLFPALFALAATSAFADAGVIKESLTEAGPIQASNSQIIIQTISTKVDYTETGDGSYGTPVGILDTERNSVGGYAISIGAMTKIVGANDYVRLQYSHNIGHTEYVGQPACCGSTNTYGSLVGTSSAALRDISLRYGSGFMFGDSAMLTPFLEIGQHKWSRGVDITSPFTYGENYSNGYYGFGLLGQYSPVHNLVLSANALIGRTKNARIDIEGTGSAGLGSSNLYEYGLSADYALASNIHVNAGIDYSKFKYGISNQHGGLWWEPDSETKYTTYKIGVGYAY